MLETVSVSHEDRVLDLGCGYGVVGLALAKAYRPRQVTMVDVDPVAVQVAAANVAALDWSEGDTEIEVLESDGFANLAGRKFTLILSNPPYHTDFSVAKEFIESGYSHLEPEGWMYLVVKRRKWYENKLRSVFGGVKVIAQDGYWVMAAQRRREGVNRPHPVQTKTTRKHAKRQARAMSRRGRRM